MRIDLFLKVAGLLKTRSIAGRAIGSGAVTLNGKPVKASAPVDTGSVITLVKPDGESMTVKILAVPESKNVSKKSRTDLYEILEKGEPGCF